MSEKPDLEFHYKVAQESNRALKFELTQIFFLLRRRVHTLRMHTQGARALEIEDIIASLKAIYEPALGKFDGEKEE